MADTMVAGGSERRAEMGLGLAALGRPGYINLGHGADVGDMNAARMEQAAHQVLDAAYASGVRHFDAARSYGRAEEFLASWLRARGIEPGGVGVSSKWGYAYTAGWRVDAERHEIKELSGAQLRRQWRESRTLLGTHLALYQIHSATLDSGVLDDPDVQRELAEIRTAGVRVGLSVTGPQQSATIDHAIEVGGFDAVQATWNLHERSADAALARACDAGMTVLIKEAVANGRLTERGGDPVLAAVAAERGTTEDAIALAAALARPWASIVLSGAATVAQLRSNVAARAIDYDAKLDERLRCLAEPARAYWETRSKLPWN